MGKANIQRGEKWSTERAKAVFQQRNKDVEWMNSQESIVNDIKAYDNSIKPTEKPKEIKSKKGK